MELTHKQVSANGGRNRAINLRKKLGKKGFSDLMRQVALKKKKGGVDKSLAILKA